jgi:type IV pilus assembly protein PilV
MHKQTTRLQRGVSMIESLVAILVLAIGVMGLAGLQTRSLVETRLTNARANALLLANDLAERMRLNRTAASGTDAAQQYTTTFTNLVTASTNCVATACGPSALRNFDLAEWQMNVRQLLPGGQAQVFAPSADGQIRILFRWRNNAAAQADGTVDASMTTPFEIDGCYDANWNASNSQCHQVFIRP